MLFLARQPWDWFRHSYSTGYISNWTVQKYTLMPFDETFHLVSQHRMQTPGCFADSKAKHCSGCRSSTFYHEFCSWAAALSKLVLATDCSDTKLEDLTETYMARSDREIPVGLRWFYCGGLGIALACMGGTSSHITCHILTEIFLGLSQSAMSQETAVSASASRSAFACSIVLEFVSFSSVFP